MEKNTSTFNYAKQLKGFLILLSVASASFTNGYTQDTYDLDIDIEGSGSVNVDPDMEEYPDGTEVEITAIPADGWTFTGWSDDVTSTDNPLTVIMDDDKDITATFIQDNSQDTYDLDIDIEGSGSVNVNPDMEEYPGGTEVEITAIPADGWTFTGWSDDVTSTDNPLTVVMDDDKDITATFTITTYTLTYNTDGNGTIDGDTPQTVNHGGNGTEVTAVPNAGYEFSQWSDGIRTISRTDTNIESDISVTAQFQLKEYALKYTAGENGSITGETTQAVPHGGNGTEVTAVPNAGYEFVQWSDGVRTASRTDESVTGDISVTAHFTSIRPTAELSGSTTICIGTTTELTVSLTGIGPWEVVYTNGDENITITEISTSPHSFEVSPVVTRTYNLLSVKDIHGEEGITQGSAIVTVDPEAEGGTVTGDLDKIMVTQSTGTLTLSGHVGDIARWQKSVDGGSWTNITNTSNTYEETPETTGMYRYRAVVQSGVCGTANSDPFEIEVENSPVIENADYNSLDGTLTIYGKNLNQENEIDVTKLTVSNGTDSYTFTNQTANVIPASPTGATIIAEGKVKAFMNLIFNNNGSHSKDNLPYNLSAAENWNGLALADQASFVSVHTYSTPSIESAIYNKLRSTLDVTASRLVAATDIMDIDATAFTITGKDNNSHTLTTNSQDVDVMSETRFIIYIGENDKAEIDQLLDITGTTSSTGHTYNLAAADRWNRPVHKDYDISDLTGNIIQAVEIENQPPQALDIAITGIPEIGNTLTGNYTYFDPEDDPEGDSQYTWYRADDASGAGEVRIEGENLTTYTLTQEDAGKFLAFEVTPVAREGIITGTPVKSDYVEVGNVPPSVTNIDLSGTLEVCKVLTVSYHYFDPEGNPEGDSEIRWFRAEDDSGINEQEIHEGPDYTLTLDDENKFIRVIVTPVASEGTPIGDPETSPYYGPVKNTLPTVSLSGPGEFCQGLTVDLTFELTGKGPWTVFYTDGTNDYEFTATASPYLLNVTEGGSYRVTGIIDTEGCEGNGPGDEIVLTSIPTVLIDDWFTEEFRNASTEWISTAASAEGANSWTFGPPQGDIFTSASAGGNIWYTNIVNSATPEQSWVSSPCFDFSKAERPMIAIDLWKEFGNNADGAVLQYLTGNNDTWRNVGTVGQGINWYNSTQIAGRPGGQQTGWTLTDQSGQSGWTDTRRDLDLLAGENFVRFRIAYGSEGSGQSKGGLAFDNIRIGKRSKLVLLEHFTNANNETSIAANQTVYDVAGSKEHDIAFISYHTAFTSGDPLNDQNAADPAARALYYGISRAPFSIVDGGLRGQGRFNYDPVKFTENDLLRRAVLEPEFELEINQDQAGDELNIEVDITSLKGFDALDLTLHVAVVETEITASQIGLQGNEVFRNVVRKLLPDAGGTVLPVNWNAAQLESYNFNWTIENVFDAENLELVAFVQDEDTREVYQVATSFDFGIPTFAYLPENPAPKEDVVFYPNPATDYLLIQFPVDISEDHILEVFNSSGNMVLSDVLNRGRNNYEANIRDLPRGIYFFRIRNNSGTLSTARVIIMK